MPNPYGAPEISVQDVDQKQKNGEQFIWLDVREPPEFAAASIIHDAVVQVPLSELAAEKLNALPEAALDKEAEIIVFCHHGVRSAQVVAWLQQQGWSNVLNMEGGIDAWANQIDPSVGTY